MNNALQLKLKFSGEPEINTAGLSPKTIWIAYNKPRFWEVKLFLNSLVDLFNGYSSLRKEWELKLTNGSGDYINSDAIFDWHKLRLDELVRIVENILVLVNNELPNAFGPSGIPGDINSILFISRKIAEYYRDALLWAGKVRRDCLEDDFTPVKEAFASYVDNIIPEIESIGYKSLKEFEEAISLPLDPDHPIIINNKITFTATGTDNLLSTLKSCIEVNRRHKSGLS